jgi:hypothetical protein
VEIFNQAVDGFDDLIQPLPDKVKGVKALVGRSVMLVG